MKKARTTLALAVIALLEACGETRTSEPMRDGGAGPRDGGAAGISTGSTTAIGGESAGNAGGASDASGGDTEVPGGGFTTATAGAGGTNVGATGGGGTGGGSGAAAAGSSGASDGCADVCPANTECIDGACRGLPNDVAAVTNDCSITEMVVHDGVIYFIESLRKLLHGVKFDGTSVLEASTGEAPSKLLVDAKGLYWLSTEPGESSAFNSLPFTETTAKSLMRLVNPQGMVLQTVFFTTRTTPRSLRTTLMTAQGSTAAMPRTTQCRSRSRPTQPSSI